MLIEEVPQERGISFQQTIPGRSLSRLITTDPHHKISHSCELQNFLVNWTIGIEMRFGWSGNISQVQEQPNHGHYAHQSVRDDTLNFYHHIAQLHHFQKILVPKKDFWNSSNNAAFFALLMIKISLLKKKSSSHWLTKK